MRGIAAAPNSPRDIMLGLVDPIDPIHNEIASKSKPRQTDTRVAPFAPLVMTASAPADGCTDRGPAHVQGYGCTSTAPLVRGIAARTGDGGQGFAHSTSRCLSAATPVATGGWPSRIQSASGAKRRGEGEQSGGDSGVDPGGDASAVRLEVDRPLAVSI